MAHTVKALLNALAKVHVLSIISTGNRAAVEIVVRALKKDVFDASALKRYLEEKIRLMLSSIAEVNVVSEKVLKNQVNTSLPTLLV